MAEDAAKAAEIEEPVDKPTEAKAPEQPTETKTETPTPTPTETTSSAPDPRDSNKDKGFLGGIGVSETGNITGFGGQELSYFGTLCSLAVVTITLADRWVCTPTVFPKQWVRLV